MHYVSDAVKKGFQKRLAQAKALIERSETAYLEAGIFGSYAREDYKSTSDIDVCIIVESGHAEADRSISINRAVLRSDLEDLGIDCSFITKEYFEKDGSIFAENLRRDYRRVL